MGGLVAKRAFILSKQLDQYVDFAQRLRAIFFLATPHRGSDSAETLKKILQATIGSRQFIDQLVPSSSTIQAINDEFPHHSESLELRSFFETKKMNLGTRKVMVVSKESATLNYCNEVTTYMDADHREVCRFVNQHDRNYLLIRDSLAKTLEKLKVRPSYPERKEVDSAQKQWLKENLDIANDLEEDLLNASALRMRGTCSWIFKKESYQRWRDNPDPNVYWLTARPGTGKSVLSGYVIENLKDSGVDCSFYFFKSADQKGSSIATFLRSIAWQMSLTNFELFKVLYDVCCKNPYLGTAEYRMVWRKLFIEGIFLCESLHSQYWIVDAIDQCRHESELVKILLKATEVGNIRTFLTSRKPATSYNRAVQYGYNMISASVEPEDTKSDIDLFLSRNLDGLPTFILDKDDSHKAMKELIWTKSSGCFLWVHLVLHELRQVHTATEVENVLESVPSDMNDLYQRILDSMSSMPYGTSLTKAILCWTACAARPLTLEELHNALQIDINDTIDSVQGAIASSCSQLIYIDAASKVHMTHQTAREFLLQPDNKSKFAIDRKMVHKRLALVCLKYLNSDEMGFHKQRGLNHHSRKVLERSAFVSYASKFLSRHISFISSEDGDVLKALAKFLNSPNVLSWIEHIANDSNLNSLVKAGKAFRNHLRRVTDTVLLAKEIALIQAWSVDLVRVVTKFGKNLSSYPSSIYHLIPPFCPTESAIRKQFANSTRSISVSGLSTTHWDDCLSTIVFQQERLTALACSKDIFAVGLSSGSIRIYDETTCQSLHTLHQNDAVNKLKFGDNGEVLAAVSRKSVRIWKPMTCEILWKFELQFTCMSISFHDCDKILICMNVKSQLLLWNLETHAEQKLPTWLNDAGKQYSGLVGSPVAVALMEGFSGAVSSHQLLAVAYRGVDIILWDIENEAMYDVYKQQSGSQGGQSKPRRGVGSAWSLTFSRILDPPLLAAAYNDGQLVIFNTGDGNVQATALAYVHQMASSPNGLMLACGNSAGTISVFDFENLTLLYRIAAENCAIKSLLFSTDSHRLIIIRDRYCQVWDPPTLLRENDDDEQKSEAFSISTIVQDIALEDSRILNRISAHVTSGVDDTIFYGKTDGRVYVYMPNYNHEALLLFHQVENISIRALVFDPGNGVLVSADLSNQIIVQKLSRDGNNWRAMPPILNSSIGDPIDQVILNANSTFLLVCSLQRDALWLLNDEGSKETVVITYKEAQKRKWCIHPLDQNILIRMSHNTAHLYQFNSLEKLTPEMGISMIGGVSNDFTVQSILPCFGNSIIATTFSDPKSSKSKSRILLWNAKDITLGSLTVTAIPHYQPLADGIEYLMGTSNDRLVFLHQDGWVCSANGQTFDIEKYHRHFFFPEDWLRTESGCTAKISPNGLITMVRGEEIAVVRNGLDHHECGQFNFSSQTGSFLRKSSSLSFDKPTS